MNIGTTAETVEKIRGDLLLIHAPAVFEFRERRDIYFPYLCTSGDVPITPLYEYFPVGFKTLQRVLTDAGFDVKIINLSSVLLKYPTIDLGELLKRLDFKLIGIDLHWMIHVQGSLAIAEQIKRVHPETPVIFGGISSTYYAEQLIQYPFIDMVMRGYDTLAPMRSLLEALSESGDLQDVPNLVWKDRAGEVHENGFEHKPSVYTCGIDWSSLDSRAQPEGLPILEILSTQNAGCPYNCGWCGGSRDAFRRVMKRKRPIARKTVEEVTFEFQTMAKVSNIDRYHFYSVGSYTESKARFEHFLDRVAATPFKSVSYEQFHLTPDHVLDHMVRANPRTIITLSPESHDLRVAKLAGRGVYTPREMEDWIERALDKGIYEIDIWYFIGMPEQDEKSVWETVDYCEHLLRKFRGKRVVPLLCPMIPFLDPASSFFEYPDEHGYRVFYRTVEEFRRGMERASLINRTNYETKWLSRRQLLEVGFRAVQRLAEIKGQYGMYPSSVARLVSSKIDDSLSFMSVVHEADCIVDPRDRARALDGLGDEIVKRNRLLFTPRVTNQAFPIDREIGGRWFDEMLFDDASLEALSKRPSGAHKS